MKPLFIGISTICLVALARPGYSACSPEHVGVDGLPRPSVTVDVAEPSLRVKFSRPPEFINGRSTPWATGDVDGGGNYCWDQTEGFTLTAEYYSPQDPKIKIETSGDVDPVVGVTVTTVANADLRKIVNVSALPATGSANIRVSMVKVCLCVDQPKDKAAAVKMFQTEGGVISDHAPPQSDWGFYSPLYYLYFKATPNPDHDFLYWKYPGGTNPSTQYFRYSAHTSNGDVFYPLTAKAVFHPKKRLAHEFILE